MTETIQLGPFYKGAATASRVKDAHRDLPFPDEFTRLTTFWAFVGAVGAAEHNLDGDALTEFLVGAATVAGRPGFWLVFNTDNEAFGADDEEHGEEKLIAETARILDRVSTDVRMGDTVAKVLDFNGNTVGEWHLS